MRGTKTEVAPGVWRLRVYVGRRPNGTPIQVTKTLRTGDGKKAPKPGSGARLADTELAKMVQEASAGRASGGGRGLTVEDLLVRWLEHCRLQNRSPTTLREYQRIVDKVLIPELGNIRLSKLTDTDLDRLYRKLTKKGLKATSVRRVHALMSASLRWGEKKKLVTGATVGIARNADPPAVETAVIQVPTPQEVHALIAAAEESEPTLAGLIVLAALTGARRGELCGLRWQDVDWEAHTLIIERSVYETPGGGWAIKGTKTKQNRRVALDDLALEVLRRQRDAVDQLAAQLDLPVAGDAFLFSRSPQGLEPIRPDVVTKFVVRMAKNVGIDTHLHALRHFSATQAIAAGFDPVTVGGRLGHSDPSVTLRVYAHAVEQRDRDLAAALGRTLALPPGK